MLPATFQFIIAMIASALTDRLTRKMDYLRERATHPCGLRRLNIEICRTTIVNILADADVEPAPERIKKKTWSAFLKRHWATLHACDFFVTVRPAASSAECRVAPRIWTIDRETTDVYGAGVIDGDALHTGERRWHLIAHPRRRRVLRDTALVDAHHAQPIDAARLCRAPNLAARVYPRRPSAAVGERLILRRHGSTVAVGVAPQPRVRPPRGGRGIERWRRITANANGRDHNLGPGLEPIYSHRCGARHECKKLRVATTKQKRARIIEAEPPRIIAHDGPAAMTSALDFHPQVALVDIGLPVMDGWELGQRLRAMRGGDHLKLIAVTGYGQDHDRARSAQNGFAAHLVKPVDLSELTKLLVN